MAKKVKTILKLNLPAGEATPAPPVGPALGQHGLPIMDFVKAYNEQTQHGLPIMDFVKAYNEQTASKKGQIIPAVITVFEDRTFSFITKLPPVAELIKKELKIEKGAKTPGREQIVTITKEQVEKIAKEKLDDLNCGDDVAAAKNIVIGTARSMGVKVQE
ncbi:MAG: 50S ribosomal protein L11 [Candidatus Shapirobacteria bacterium]|nr:50S ribosomal protein L11 [Candidatus Shapirobacteria bacterium]